jgi:UPF0716 family protein affecting phage T7 exclusion
MREQSYANHPHHPKLTYAASAFTLVALGCFIAQWAGLAAMLPGVISLTLAVLVLVSISRVYIVALQDRIIRLEMRLRAKEVLTAGEAAALWRLSRRQIVALRFASDAELPGLIDRATREGLTADQIKRAIRTWVADYERT